MSCYNIINDRNEINFTHQSSVVYDTFITNKLQLHITRKELARRLLKKSYLL